MQSFWWKILVVLACYLWGSLNLAFIAGKRMRGEDLRHVGSGNLGTSNVYINISKRAGTLVFLGDCFKAAAPVVIARLAGASLGVQVACALAVMAGHNWPVWLRFRGGRGLAVAYVNTLILFPWGGLVLTVILAIANLTRGHTAEITLLGLALEPILAWRLFVPASIIAFTLGVLVFTILRRLQGSAGVNHDRPPQPWRTVLTYRLCYDREAGE